MATKLAKAALTGGHTAGIYADMSIDGPEIGTLVVIIDRAKNLPNRKTMGKQDPYCAARLGKEAKKTETDRRGGQTPKWDQELRFTVHDALDYHQLKVSVFNDDKKTDLIGETWVQLEIVLLPGGGKSDAWHTLNCRGRYAGEIRIELTYYDSRPREEKPDDTPSASPIPRSDRDSPMGSRQAKPVKRRPLPANPTQSTSQLVPSRGPRPLPGTSADSTFLPSMYRAQEQVNMSTYAPSNYDDSAQSEVYADDYRNGFQSTDRLEQREPDAFSSNFAAALHERDYSTTESEFRRNLPYPSSPQDLQPSGQDEPSYGGFDLPELPPLTPRTNRSSAAPTPKYYTPANSSPSYTLPQYDRSPDAAQPYDHREPRQSYQSSQPHQPSPLRTQSTDDSYGHEQIELYQGESPRHHSAGNALQVQDYEPYNVQNDRVLPPLPPMRSGRSDGYHDGPHNHQQPLPAPLPIRHLKGSNSGSALTLSYAELPDTNQRYSVSPSESNLSTLSAPLTSNYSREYDDRISPRPPHQDPRRSAHSERFPPLDDHPTNAHSRSFPNTPQSYGSRTSNGYETSRNPNTFRQSHHLSNQFGPGYETAESYDKQAPRQSPYANQTPPSQYGDRRNGWPNHGDMARVHRASAPIIKPRAVSPDSRTPIRKSVSPHPDSAPRDSGSRGAPFSPDSYEQFNPNLGSAKSINAPTPKYNTPESIREAARDREKEEKLKAGPIVDSSGRVVDPSDHLPAETWAPEPEKKTPRKSHQINVKFRHSPQGTQSLPTSAQRLPPRQPVMRPQPIPPMTHAHSTNDVSPTPVGRNRLQKRNGPAPVHFNSSPAVPMSYGTPPPQALREHPNYGSYGNSPSYARGSPGGLPPVPAKVPMGAEQEDWDVGGMEDEFSSIDIGPGRPRRTQLRYGG
ncbi:hypothetical protein MMC10_002971 [Thelotrema lepadinum]|nr:hypothetical protein [Thelotrema lepadinum]